MLACLPLAGGSADTTDVAAPAKQKSGWSASIGHDESKSQATETTQTIRLRVYDEPGRLGGDGHPGNRHQPGIAVDVETRFVTCPDGRTRVERVNIGGREFNMDGKCIEAGHDSKITVERRTVAPEAPAPESDERSTGNSSDE